MTDFWPAELGTKKDIETPISIVNSLASELSAKTNNLLQGRVVTKQSGKFDMVHIVYLTVPQLDYSFELLYVNHALTLYPVTITCPLLQDGRYSGKAEAKTPDEMKASLTEILRTPTVIDATKSLITQAIQAAESSEGFDF